jgi:hypothetical protein
MQQTSILLIPVMLGMIANASAQTPTTQEYFQHLKSATATVPSDQELLNAVDQIPNMSQSVLNNALPDIFEAMKVDGPGAIHAAFALTVVARRTDSGDLLKDRIPEVAALLSRQDPRFKTFAALVFVRMIPTPKDVVVPILSRFILTGKATPADKLAPAGALIAMAPTAPETEQSLLYLLGLPLDTGDRIRLVNGVGTNQIKSEKIIDAVAQSLNDSNEDISLAAIQSITRLGPVAVVRCMAILSSLASDSGRSEPVRRLAQNAVNNTTEDCRTLMGLHKVACPTP